MKKFRSILVYFLLFVFSLFFFLYIMFPYNILKETIVTQVSANTGLTLSVNDISPKYSFGLNFTGIELSAPGRIKTLKIEKVGLSLNLFYLLAGNIHVSVGVYKTPKGLLEGSMDLPILALMSGQTKVKNLEVVSEDFSIGEYVDFAFEGLSKAPDANPMLGGLLDKVAFIGDLYADVDLDVDANLISNSKGKVLIELKDAKLQVKDPEMDIDDQVFNNAKVSGVLANGIFSVSENSSIVSKDLELLFKGKFTLDNNIGASSIDLTIPIKLKEKFKEQFGFWLDAFTGKSNDGDMTIQVRGNIGAPSVTTI
ncbi:MAG: type II secretion system protein GspN [Oligoflexales bacterium]|nr:type II secretion system protein GspN [Oligoflexales bacterium]